MFGKNQSKGHNLESKKGGGGHSFLSTTPRPDLIHIPVKLHISLGNVNEQISIIYHSYGTCQCTKKVFWPLVPLLF